MKKISKALILSLFIILLGGCFESNNLENANITTTSYPIEFLTNYLYGNNSTVTSIYPAGVDINTYKLSKKQIKEYAKSDLFIYNGLTNEKEIAKELINKNKNMLIIDVSYGLKYNYGIEELWLSPNNFLMLGKNIKEYLKEYIDSKYTLEEIDANYKNFEETMSVMDAELRQIVKDANKDKKSTTLIVASNTFKYLTNYGFNVISLEDEENLSTNNLNNIKTNFKNGTYSSILIFSTEDKSDIVNELVNDYSAKLISVNEMYSLSEENKEEKNDYISIMEDYIDNIRTIILK